MKKIIYLLVCASSTLSWSQLDKDQRDSLYIEEIENKYPKDKVLHAEPLYIDLIRDLGARKGEKEWNLGFGLTDKDNFDEYEALIEYEWAPMDRLGLEVELPFSFEAGHSSVNANARSGLNSLKLAAQWSFLVNEKHATSMAVGYINELLLTPQILTTPEGNVFNPFLVMAKRWGQNFHTLIYTGPHISYGTLGHTWHSSYAINTNVHYMIDGTRNFIGMEINKNFARHHSTYVLRPQMRLGINDQMMLGIVAGIPLNKEHERFSTFLRLIWEPKH
ncbi:hypothetical protein SAMN05216474_0366 [Lishizhenia tianjinensis]|uniref:Phosphoribosylformylglycinamidine synthase n=1 Tax=Lishizhenia tianjinensis TaxID=477690 RepID=A0A1I6XPD9_9FLAO|nr:HAEPLYID family protein [Lishizhenia tianjinensis]SFT40309.1 hypothetical protein SAMN05216474_0366 [Lishizhenia tianjinensis]